ncbi:MAG: hypothetical protein IPL06_14490 [Betaproteobacteria bacterium]|nr:hypothetical protein [Betaproteobacteria bacterium]
MVVPYSKLTVVVAPMPLTRPLRVAPVAVTALAALVVAVGATGAAAGVVKLWLAPRVVPALLVPLTRNW